MLSHEHYALTHLATQAATPAPRVVAPPWGLEPGCGPLQGPLDLGFFCGQAFCLDLGPHQVALLTGEGRLSRLFPEGRHLLSVGAEPGQISPHQQLILLDTAMTVDFEWTRSDPITIEGEIPQAILGKTSLVISDPTAFFATFLSGHSCLEPAFVWRLLGQTVRAGLQVALNRILTPETRGDFSLLQAALLPVGPDLLAAQLLPCGLRCESLSLYAPALAGLSPKTTSDIAGHCLTH